MKRPESLSRRVLLVLGMHRSGTSAVTRIVNLLGAELGGELVPPGADNPAGFWEHAEAVRINDDLLDGLGRTWYDMRDMPDGWTGSPPARSAMRRIGELIERDFAASVLCAVKDPRMCLTAPLWIEAFEARGFEVDCLFVVRHPRAVVESLHRRNDWPREPLYLMWVQYLMEATAASGHRRRSMLDYDRLLADWRGSMARVARELDLCWPVAPDGAVAETIDAFLDPDRRHHAEPSRGVDGEAATMPGLVLDLYRACTGIASGDEKWAAISGFHDSFREIARLYAAHVDHLLVERWGAEERAQTAEARLAAQVPVTAAIRDAMGESHVKLDARLGSLERELAAIARRAGRAETKMAARLEEQACASIAIRDSVLQLQKEMSALSGEIAARFERQCEGIMAVEARLQRQYALLNTISLRLEQTAGKLAERPDHATALPETEVQKLRSALAGSHAMIAALLASTSWKLTAPLRWLSVHLLRRPPALIGTATPASAEPGPRRDAPGDAPIVVRQGTAGADDPAKSAPAAVRTRPDRHGKAPEPVAFRWI